MYKAFITLAVTLAVTTTPAMAQQYRFPSKSQRAEMAAAQASGEAVSHQGTSTASSFREPTGYTREQLLFAVDMQREAVRMCRKGNFSTELNRSLAQAGTNIATVLVEKALNRRSYGIGRSNYGNSRDSSQDCNDLGERVYQDALRVEVSSYCDESMTNEYRRGGQAVAEERMVRRCQARKADSSWSASFQPKN